MTTKKRKPIRFKRTRWFKKWVWVSAGGEEPFHGLCLGAFKEVDCWYYQFQMENGDMHSILTLDVGGMRVSKADLKLAKPDTTVVRLSKRPHGGGDGTGTRSG